MKVNLAIAILAGLSGLVGVSAHAKSSDCRAVIRVVEREDLCGRENSSHVCSIGYGSRILFGIGKSKREAVLCLKWSVCDIQPNTEFKEEEFLPSCSRE